MAACGRNQNETEVNVLIVGGGFVGNTLAAALAGTGVSSALVDTADLRQIIDDEFDGRSFAVSLSNQRLLAGVGIWAGLAARAAPIRRSGGRGWLRAAGRQIQPGGAHVHVQGLRGTRVLEYR